MLARLILPFAMLMCLTAPARSQPPSAADAKKIAKQRQQQAKERQQQMADQFLMSHLIRAAQSRELQAEIKLDQFQTQMLRETVQVFQQKMQEFHREYGDDQLGSSPSLQPDPPWKGG